MSSSCQTHRLLPRLVVIGENRWVRDFSGNLSAQYISPHSKEPCGKTNPCQVSGGHGLIPGEQVGWCLPANGIELLHLWDLPAAKETTQRWPWHPSPQWWVNIASSPCLMTLVHLPYIDFLFLLFQMFLLWNMSCISRSTEENVWLLLYQSLCQRHQTFQTHMYLGASAELVSFHFSSVPSLPPRPQVTTTLNLHWTFSGSFLYMYL